MKQVKLQKSVALQKSQSSVVTGNVQVYCRFRPLNQREKEIADTVCVSFKDQKSCSVNGINKNTGITELIDYNFDRVFDLDSRQEQIFNMAVRPIVESVLDGYNGSIMAYG